MSICTVQQGLCEVTLGHVVRVGGSAQSCAVLSMSLTQPEAASESACLIATAATVSVGTCYWALMSRSAKKSRKTDVSL